MNERRKPVLLSWPLAALACAVCLLGGLVGGVLIGRHMAQRPANGTPRETAGFRPLPTPPPVPTPPANPPTHPPLGQLTTEIIAVDLRVFARPDEQLFAAPPRKLYCQVTVRFFATGSQQVALDLAGADVQVTTDSGLRFASLGVLPKQFDWADAEALRSPTRPQSLLLAPDQPAPPAVALLFLVPEGVRPFALNVRGGKAVRIDPTMVTHVDEDATLADGTFRRDELGAFSVADAPPLAAIMDHNKAVYDLLVHREEDLFSLSFPTLHVQGWVVASGNGQYNGTLADEQDEKLPVTLRVLDGGQAVLLYLTEGPHGTILFRRRPPQSQPTTAPADGADGG